MKKTLLILFFGLLQAPDIYAQSNDTQPPAYDTTGPRFTLINHDSSVNFDAVYVNTTAEYKFEFINSGHQPLVIMDMYCAGDKIGPEAIVQIKWPKKPVKPGKKGIITITVTAKNNLGSFSHEIYIVWNITHENYPLLRIRGAIIPESRMQEDKLQVDGWFQLLTPVIQAVGK